MLKKIIPIILFFISVENYNFAQNNNFTISGTIFDSISKIPVNYCTIILLNEKDSIFIAGTISNEKGEFSIKNLKAGNKIIEISFAGEKQFQKLLNLNNNIVLDTIFLTPNILNEVVIEESPFYRDIDKLIVSIANLKLKEDATTINVLEALPGAYHNKIQGKYTIIGKDVRVIIDDEPQRINFEQLAKIFNNQSAKNIEKVEIMFTPPPKYVDEWDGAVINIITKKISNNIIIGTISSWLSYRQKFNNESYASLNIQNEKITFNLVLLYKFNQRINTENESQKNIKDNFFSLIDTSHSEGFSHFGDITIGLSYNVNSKNTIGINTDFSILKGNAIRLRQIFRYNNIGMDSVVQNEDNDILNSIRNLSSVFYKYAIDGRRHFITLSGNYSFDKENTVVDKNYSYFDRFNDFNDIVKNKNNDKILQNIFSVNIDHFIKIKDKIEITDGISFVSENSNSSTKYQTLISNNWQINNQLTNQFSFNQNSFRAYLSFGHQVLKKFSYRLALRAFYYLNFEKSNSLNINHDYNFFSILPSAYLNFSPNDFNMFELNYNLFASIPDISQLFPYKIYSSSEYYTEGNPYLKPSYTNRIEFTYGQLDYDLFFKFCYRNKDNFIDFKPIIDTNLSKIVGGKYINFGKSQEYNVSIPYFISLIDDRLEINLDGSLSYQKVENNEKTFKNSIFHYGAYIDIAYTLKKIDLTFSISESYDSPQIFGYSKNKGGFQTSLSIDYEINSKWSVVFDVTDLFHQDRYNSIYVYDNIEYFYNAKYDHRFFRLRIEYSFGNKK
ncbi:MAG: outer membrane beta-barrel protein [Bacteroidales bacterium]|nr:outer membrane beta-barrel protein [Bacteroidales bacterium]